MRFPNGAGTEFSCLNCRENLKSNNFTLVRIIPYLYGVLAVTTKKEPKLQENLKLRNLKSLFTCTYVVRVFLEQNKNILQRTTLDCFLHMSRGNPNNTVLFMWKPETTRISSHHSISQYPWGQMRSLSFQSSPTTCEWAETKLYNPVY